MNFSRTYVSSFVNELLHHTLQKMGIIIFDHTHFKTTRRCNRECLFQMRKKGARSQSLRELSTYIESDINDHVKGLHFLKNLGEIISPLHQNPRSCSQSRIETPLTNLGNSVSSLQSGFEANFT